MNEPTNQPINQCAWAEEEEEEEEEEKDEFNE